MPVYEALRLARESNVDLVEVAPTAAPPVCRLLDYGKFKYEQEKKEREARKNQKVSTLKGMRLSLKINDHDLEFKTNLIEDFLREGDKVKVTVLFRGREITRSELGRQILNKVIARLKDVAVVERSPLMEGKTLTMILSPAAGIKKAVEARQAVAAPKTGERVDKPAPTAPRLESVEARS